MTTFPLAVCAEMVWRDRPIDWRASHLKEMRFGVGLWNWPDHFTIMNGYLRGRLTDDEGAPEAWLVFEPEMLEGLRSVRCGDEVIVITWLDRARRDVLSVHPRGDTSMAQEGVFSTRSPHRPNPIGLHRVEITAITVDECECAISKCWMGRRSSTSSRSSAETSASAEQRTGGSLHPGSLALASSRRN